MESTTTQQKTVAEKLDMLMKLQNIDLELDEIKKIRGALPEEVSDLEDEIAGYQTRHDKYAGDVEQLEQDIENNKAAIKEAEGLIKKYEEQQMNVRNNREYDAITKEMELQNLEIQISEKRTKEAYAKIEQTKEQVEDTKALIEQRQKDLESKQQELEKIVAESEEEEKQLLDERGKVAEEIGSVDRKLLNYYEKLRNSLSNGLAVVKVVRGAAEGCNIIIPPQRIVEIKERKRLIFDEYSGRILADVEEEEIKEEPKPKRGRRKAKS
ncbi:MAG: zinc ribbon domain-containing protein [Cyclobacteriaceae bacterium]